MKQNNKIKIFVLGCFVFGLFGFGVLATPINVAAACNLTAQDQSSPSSCTADGGVWTPNLVSVAGGTCSCPTGTSVTPTSNLGTTGSPCGLGQPACGVGWTCSGLTQQCGTSCTTQANCASNQYCDLSGIFGGACITGVSPSTVQTTPPASPITPSSPTQGGCPTGLNNTNGVCLPPSQYTTGIAASTSLTDFILKLVKILLTFAGMIAVVMLVIGGYWYMAAGGNEEMSEKGKKTILNFVMGLVIIVLAYTIVSIIASTLTGADKLLQ